MVSFVLVRFVSDELTFLHVFRSLNTLLNFGFIGQILLACKCLVQTCSEVIVSLRIFTAHEKQVYMSLVHLHNREEPRSSTSAHPCISE